MTAGCLAMLTELPALINCATTSSLISLQNLKKKILHDDFQTFL